MLITLEDFVDDPAWSPDPEPLSEVTCENQIEGVTMHRLLTNKDKRGDLTVLMSDLYHSEHSTPHVYLVTAAAASIRAWVYHKRQYDRLAFTQGKVRVALFDLRTESPTFQNWNILNVGAQNKVLLKIPPFVVHGVQNRGAEDAQFINMPTRAYDPARPDKIRLPYGHPGISNVFDD